VRSKPAASTTSNQKTAALAPRQHVQGKSKKLTYKEERELAELPARLEALEKEQGQINGQLADPALYRDRPGEVKALQARHTAVEAELARLLARWEELEAKVSG